LLVIDNEFAANELLAIHSRLRLDPALEIGLLLLVDPGDISPANAYYDDVMEQLQRRSYQYLHHATRLMQASGMATFLRISRHADRMIAAVAQTFDAHYILLSTPPGRWRGLVSPDEFTEYLRLVTSIPIIQPAQLTPVRMTYQLCQN